MKYVGNSCSKTAPITFTTFPVLTKIKRKVTLFKYIILSPLFMLIIWSRLSLVANYKGFTTVWLSLLVIFLVIYITLSGCFTFYYLLFCQKHKKMPCWKSSQLPWHSLTESFKLKFAITMANSSFVILILLFCLDMRPTNWQLHWIN